MFTPPTFYKYYNSEFIQYLTDIKNIVQKRNPKILKVLPQAVLLNKQLTHLSAVYKRELDNTIARELEALEKRRELAIMGIRSVAEAFTYHFDIAKCTAGEELIKSMDRYGLKEFDYQTQTTTIHNLTEDWDKTLMLKAALVTLDIIDWAQELKESNESFNSKYLERSPENDVLDNKMNFTNLRDKAKESYDILISHITKHAVLTVAKKYEIVIKEINRLTEEYNIKAEQRGNINNQIKQIVKS
ncbi:DUF6261 family protein [Aquimarina celericrescens]|uniref:DUF6261 family protein n=1 Tax=Aquimarina celericrescens TaxID=1964542 RepID=A0ABW5ASY5_9FLAO|nr:hypothetical protein [Aquimarina celericrescens]